MIPIVPSGAVIRRMRQEDVPTVHAIDTLSFNLPWPEHSFLYEVNENPAARAWVIENSGRILGMLVLWLIVDEAHIATLATHPDFRRQGFGERILIAALKAARLEGARRAFLEVRAGNLAAHALYHKHGFQITGRRPSYYKDTGEDALLMTLDNLDSLEDG